MKVVDLTGMTFGRLTVIERGKNSKTGQAYWWCFCECGEVKQFRGTHLTSGRSTSCGCYSVDRAIKHRMSGTPEYRAYYNMIKRCEYINDHRYMDYGGRGIRVCPEWRESFEQFLADMGPRPTRNHSIDRIDVNGHYEPKNCRWAVKETQEHNKRPRKDSPVGVRGVRHDGQSGKYIAQIYVNGKTRRIGTFITLEEASAARKEAEARFWGVNND
ncbi:AP2 domain-containing protein [Paenibacillus oleatilyticus]|uniref:AP2 domain-containing protein n=1 Tax=Paenibacillus oleatilyticus TaxID=2594886 RepID=A0ABV4V6N4_9BACL